MPSFSSPSVEAVAAWLATLNPSNIKRFRLSRLATTSYTGSAVTSAPVATLMYIERNPTALETAVPAPTGMEIPATAAAEVARVLEDFVARNASSRIALTEFVIGTVQVTKEVFLDWAH